MDRKEHESTGNAGDQDPEFPKGFDFQYPFPSAYCPPDPRIFPVQIFPVKPKTMVDNDWLDDAPMPSDSEYSPNTETTSTSSSKSQPTMGCNSQNPEEPPKPSVQEETDCPMQEDTPPVSSEQATPVATNSFPIETSKDDDVYPPEPTLIKVLPCPTRIKIDVVRDPNERRPWCTVYYYERTQRVGKAFYAYQPSFTIDATGCSNSQRMALSELPTTTQPKAAAVRNQTGDGIRLTVDNGHVWLTAISDQAFFVQSAFWNKCRNAEIGSVYKLKNEASGRNGNGLIVEVDKKSVKLFDPERFEYERNVANELPAEQASQRLLSYCTARVSFIKGFGEDYSCRPLTDCPCWIEVQLTEPFDVYDRYLRTHNTGPDEMNSRS